MLRDIVLTVFVFSLLPVALVRPDVGILLWTWFGLMNPHKMTWDFAYDFQYAVIIGAVTIVSILFSREPKRLPLSAPVIALMMWVLWMTVTTFAFSLWPEFAMPQWEKVIKIQLFIFLTMMVMQSEKRIRALVLVATLSIAYFGIKGGVYTIGKGGGGMVLGPDGGFISGNTEIATALVVTLPLMRWLQLQTQRRWLKHAATISMVLIGVSVLGSQSRGGFLALAAMSLFLLMKSRAKVVLGVTLAVVAAGMFAFMPDSWHSRMGTIDDYQEDNSAQGRIFAWRFATRVAVDRPLGGGGFEMWERQTYRDYFPEGVELRVLAPHSIWFQTLGEHGFVGFGLFVMFWILTWRTGTRIIKLCRKHAELTWARDLAAMIQAGLMGYFVGGSFLGLAYWDFPYVLAAVLVLTRVVVERQIKEGAASANPTAAAGPARLRTQS
jgi:putative inorganic carbon (HCO3(-)) transporter